MDKKVLQDHVDEINDLLEDYLPREDTHNAELAQAAAYAVQAGGKRLRPMLMQETYRLFAGGREEPEILYTFMAAIEFIHTYSLVHDDLPAMDNDEYRRGQLTVHAKYGEAAGILIGDAMLNLAYEIIFRAIEESDDPDHYLAGISSARVLAAKAGMYGMVGGQYLDVYAEKHEGFSVDGSCMDYIYRNKTSALIEASMMAGAILAGASAAEVEAVEYMARNIGYAFQIRDDILDVTGSQELLGKPVGSDEKNEKQTYVALHGLEKAQEAVREYSETALNVFDSLGRRNPFLRELIVTLIEREK